MGKMLRFGIGLVMAQALALTGCRPAIFGVSPMGAPSEPTAVSAVNNPVLGTGNLAIAINWPLRVQELAQRGVQTIPQDANSLYLTISKRSGVLLQDYVFSRPSVTSALLATASLPVRLSTESLVVQVNAYRESIATTSEHPLLSQVLPKADRIIAQGTRENVAVTLNETTAVKVQLDPEMTVAGIGGTAALGNPARTKLSLVNLTGTVDERGPAYWTMLLNPANLRYDSYGRFLYFTQDPDPGHAEDGPRIWRLSMNPNTIPLTSYGWMTVVAGGGANSATGSVDALRAGRNMGSASFAGKPRQAHFGKIVDLALSPVNQQATSLYVLQGTDPSGEAVFKITGLDQLQPDNLVGWGSAPDAPGVTVNQLIDNIASESAVSNRIINGPTSLAIFDSNVYMAMAGTFHWIIQGVDATISADLGAGYTPFAGCSVKGYNMEGPPALVQIDTPRASRFDRKGNLFFLANNAKGATILRMVTKAPNSRISTIAGGGSQTPPSLTDPVPPIPGTSADLGSVAAMDIDSQGNIFLASGSKIYRYDPATLTMVSLYDSTNGENSRTYQSIAYDENDRAIYFTYSGESKIKKIYLSRLF